MSTSKTTPALKTSANSITEQVRLHSLDTTRGIAVMAILLMNIWGFGLPFEAYANPNAYGGIDGWNLTSWFISAVFFEGTARGLFSLLFGAGFILMLNRLEKLGMHGMDIYTRRLGWLLLFGLFHGYILLWTGDILFRYAVMGFLLLAFRSVKPKTLLVLTVLLLLLDVARYQFFTETKMLEVREKATISQTLKDGDTVLTEQQQNNLQAWEEMQKPFDQELIDEDVKGYQGSYSDSFKLSIKWMEAQATYLFNYAIFDILVMFFIGAALMKLGFWQRGFATRSLCLMVLIGYGIGLSARYYYVQAEIASDFDIYSRMAYAEYKNIWRILVTIGHLGVITLFCRSGILMFLQKALGNVGRMALTNYISQTILASIFFYGTFMGNYAKLERVELWYVVAAIWTFNIVFSHVWLKLYYYGPLEWLWRALTYGDLPEMKRS